MVNVKVTDLVEIKKMKLLFYYFVCELCAESGR